jgi:hypothetical protein
MINMKYLLLFSSLCIALLSCAQAKHLVKDAYATYTVHLPGNIAVDKNGNSISPGGDTLIVIYVAAKGQIRWTGAWKDGKDYSVIQTLTTGSLFEAGINKTTNEKIILYSTKGNLLWRLQLVPGGTFFPVTLKTLPGEIILRGNYHGKKMTQKISKQTEIVPIPSS